MNLPDEIARREDRLKATRANTANAASDLQAQSARTHHIYRLDGTYALHAVALPLPGANVSRLPDTGGLKLALAIINKTTGANKYIGSLYLTGSSTLNVSAAAATIHGNVVGARLAGGVLDLWIAQGTYTTNVATDIYGLFKKSLTLNLDF